MVNEFIPYTEALALKELGFDEPCLCYYDLWNRLQNILNHNGDRIVNAPLYQQAFRWFREEYHLRGQVISDYDKFSYQVLAIYEDSDYKLISGGDCDQTYDIAELNCLRELIELANGKEGNK